MINKEFAIKAKIKQIVLMIVIINGVDRVNKFDKVDKYKKIVLS